jgi:hypothetical protein
VTATAVTGACGDATDCTTLEVTDPTDVRVTPDTDTVCEGESVIFTATATPVGGTFTYVWKHDGVTLGETSDTLTIPSASVADAGEYCVTATATSGACGKDTACATLRVDQRTDAGRLLSQEACPGTDVEFTYATEPSGEEPLSYEWTKQGDPTVLSTEKTLKLTNVQPSDAGTYCVKVTGSGACPPDSTCATLAVTGCSEEFCTFTQGFWGNYGGKFEGFSKEQLLTGGGSDPYNLMATDLVIGVVGFGSLTIPSASWECIIKRLPAGSSPKALLGDDDVTMSGFPTCTASNVSLKNEKFQNVLVGQVIALSLNVRLDPDLLDLGLCNLMTTVPASPGPDGIHGNEDDFPIPGGTPKTVFISQSILDALDNEGLDQTVGGLLELANRALAGLSTGGASVSSINGAVDAINNGFDGCRLLTSCESLPD